MTIAVELGLAHLGEAPQIARMSRDCIETGLGWRWNTERIVAQIRCPDTLVVAARAQQSLIGFAIMHFLQQEAHLLLLAVQPSWRRSGIARRLLDWLEKSARVAGIDKIQLEVRANNTVAQCFYKARGYQCSELLPGYYLGREAAVRMVLVLHAPIR